MADIFLSYAREDRARVEVLAALLHGAGFSVWWDRHIAGGAHFSKETEAELALAKTIVVVWSAASQGSHWVADEAAEGRDTGRLVPVGLDGSNPPLGFRQFQVIDFRGWRDDGAAPFPDLVAAIAAKATATRPPAPMPAAASRPASSPAVPSRTMFRLGIIVAGVVALGLVGALFVIPTAERKGDGAARFSNQTDRREGRKETYASIAVLPFVDMSEAKDQAYFSDGIAEELLNVLARNRALKVAARTSSFLFKAQDKPIAEIAAALNVETVLEGSVRKAGNRLRITAQLIDAETGFHLWSQTYDRDLDDIFALQDEIAGAIVSQLNKTLTSAPPADRPTNSEAYEAYLAANHEFHQSTSQSLKAARALYEKVIALEPSFAAAHVGQGRTVLRLRWSQAGYVPDKEAIAIAGAAAAAALRIDPGHAEALRLDAFARQLGGEKGAAFEIAERLYALDQDAARTNVDMGSEMYFRGRYREALPFLEKAIEVDPFGVDANRYYGFALWYLGRDGEAVAQLRRAIAYNRPSAILSGALAGFLEIQGDCVGALAAALPLLEIAPDREEVVAGYAVAALAALGFVEEAEQLDIQSGENIEIAVAAGLAVGKDTLLAAIADEEDLFYRGYFNLLNGNARAAAPDMMKSYDPVAIKGLLLSGRAPDLVFALQRGGQPAEAEKVASAIAAFTANERAEGGGYYPLDLTEARTLAALGRDAEAAPLLAAAAGRNGFFLLATDPVLEGLRNDKSLAPAIAAANGERERQRKEAVAAGLIERVRDLIPQLDAADAARGQEQDR